MDAFPTRLRGLGGWLILLGIGLVITPFRLGAFIATGLLPAFEADTWADLTTPGSQSYHPLWAPILIFELIGNVVCLLFAVLLLFFFFLRKRAFPRLAITFFVVNLAFVVADYFLADAIPAVAQAPSPDADKELGKTFLGCVIWVPYLLRSTRVEATFTE